MAKTSSGQMLQFVETERDMPEKRDSAVRKDDFLEIYGDYIDVKAEEQASRCSQCGVPFCQNHCPLDNNIPDWLKLTAEGRIEELSRAKNARSPLASSALAPQVSRRQSSFASSAGKSPFMIAMTARADC